ncbi:uncharacterized protein LOC120337872 [Styela clava]
MANTARDSRFFNRTTTVPNMGNTSLWAVENNNTRNRSIEFSTAFSRWFCYENKQPIGGYKAKCCKDEYDRYKERWFNGGYYITTLLERLERWQCEEFKMECTARTYNFTTFTDLVYDKFCDRRSMEFKCKSVVTSAVEDYEFLDSSEKLEWMTLANSLVSSKMKIHDVIKPCIQIAIFDSNSGGVGRIHEIVEPYLPFCGLLWDGYDIDTAENVTVSAWTNLNVGCAIGVGICMAVMIIAGIATIIANVTILAVFATNKKLRNTQSIYQISLAIADLIVGLMVWPNMIVMQFLVFINPRLMGDVITLESLTDDGKTAYFPNSNGSLVQRFPGGTFGEAIYRPYMNYLGFFTNMSITVSIYTLMAASIHRLRAVSSPLNYHNDNVKKHAYVACIIIWVISVITSILPVLVRSIQYTAISSIMIAPENGNALLLVTFVLPLITTWIVSAATLEVSRRYAQKRSSLSSHQNAANLEKRMARTLGLMVSVFSISVLPATMCIAVGLVPETVFYWTDPQRLNVTNANIYMSFSYISIIILTANSLWNCFIYSLRNLEFRKAALRIYTKMFHAIGIAQRLNEARIIGPASKSDSTVNNNTVRKV